MRSASIKLFFNLVGMIAVMLGIVGIFLPLLPTTPFLLLASACFMRGSTRMHHWLLNNRLFGEYLKNIHDKRGIPRKSKVVTLILLWASLSVSIYLMQALWLKLFLVGCGLGVSTWILRMKTLQPQVQQQDV